MSADRIEITGLAARTVIGFNEWERGKRQDVLLRIALDVDLAAAGLSDNVEASVDYRAVKKAVLASVEASSFHLIESLAESVARLCLQQPRVDAVTVRVEKPGALRFAQSVAVEITRRRS